MFHLFVYVVRSIQDPFAGIRAKLQAEGASHADIRLTDGELDLVDAVEYSTKRPLRAWHYRRIFRNLEAGLSAVLAEHPGPVCVYFSDEGVWAVFWSRLRERLGRKNIVAVNVQHGHAPLQPPVLPKLRRLINAVALALTRYPVVGYGSAGGAGPGPFDIYLTYNEVTAAFARRQSGRAAAPAPYLIKHEVAARFDNLPKKDHGDPVRVLFAMNIDMAGSPIICNASETYDVLLVLAHAVRELGAEFVIRLHPAMERAAEIRRFAAHPIARVSVLDRELELHASMARARIVMSYYSTVLWDGGLLGLVPVQVICRCCKPVDLGFPREILDLEGDVRQQLAGLMGVAARSPIMDWRSHESREWASFRELLGTLQLS